MLNLKDLSLSDIPAVQPFLGYQHSRICDYSIGGIFMWREYFHTRFTIFEDTLLFQVRYLNGATAFPVPIGANQKAALEQIELYCRQNSIPLVFCTVPNNVLSLLKERYPDAEILPNRDWYDYLYRTQDLLEFRGKKYDGQRNHIHKFQKTCPGAVFREITEESLPRVREFYAAFAKAYEKPDPIAQEESSKVAELLEHYAEYGLFGGFLEVNGAIVSMSIGERVNDTLFVHIEKADIRYPGAYQVTVQEFLKHFARSGDTFVNREEDVGDEGLRKSKLSYHPVELLEKSTVLVKSLPEQIG